MNETFKNTSRDQKRQAGASAIQEMGNSPSTTEYTPRRTAQMKRFQELLADSPRLKPTRQLQETLEAGQNAPEAKEVIQGFFFQKNIGTKRRPKFIESDIDTPEDLEEFYVEQQSSTAILSIFLDLRKAVFETGERDMVLMWNELMNRYNGEENRLKAPAEDAIPPTDKFHDTIVNLEKKPIYKNMESFLKRIAGGEEIEGYKKSNFESEIWSHSGNKMWVKTMGRARGGDHEWLPTSMIGDLVTKKTRSDEWTDFYFTMRSRTSSVLFSSTVAANDDSGKEVLTGHSGALSYVDSKGKRIASTKKQKQFHDELRSVIVDNEDPDKVKPGLKLVAQNWIWRGDDPFPEDKDMHPRMYHMGNRDTALFPRGGPFESLKAHQKGFYDDLVDTKLS